MMRGQAATYVQDVGEDKQTNSKINSYNTNYWRRPFTTPFIDIVANTGPERRLFCCDVFSFVVPSWMSFFSSFLLYTIIVI